MRVLHVSPSFYPATYFGGPIYSTYALCNALASNPEVALKVLTTDSAGPRLRDRLEVKASGPMEENRYPVYYCKRWLGMSFSPGLLARLMPMIRWADVVHLTAVYSAPTVPTLLMCKALKKPVVWSPRGSLQRWQGSSRPLMKRLWETTCDWLNDKARVTVHATSGTELADSRLRIKRAEFVMIPNGVNLPAAVRNSLHRESDMLRLLCLGRLDKIKGIENLLTAVKEVDGPVTLSICGEGSPDYTQSLKALAQELNLNGEVKFEGHVTGEEKQRAFESSDVFIMPSHNESFGLSAAEALSYGLPVIASKGTPWSEVETKGCGLWVENNPQSLTDAINRIRQMPLQEMGSRGREWMLREFSWDVVAGKMFKVYQELACDH